MQYAGDRLADAPRCAGDERLAAGQFEHVFLLARSEHPVTGCQAGFRQVPPMADSTSACGADRHGGDVAVDASSQSGKYLAGADLVKRGEAVRAEPLDGLAPAHTSRDLLDQAPRDLVPSLDG
jgi:hypothetical protein